VKLAPWAYLFKAFNSLNFHDIFYPTWVMSLVFLVLLVVLYNVRTRQLHRHPPYLDMYEWLLWTGIISFSLLTMYSLFVFYFVFVLATEIIMLAVFIWIRFIHFPPTLAGYQNRLAKQRYFTRLKYAHPESTIRAKSSKAVRTTRPGKPVRRSSRRRR
jgi:hypothetical protein